jgi:hypothetical protein
MPKAKLTFSVAHKKYKYPFLLAICVGVRLASLVYGTT